MPGPMSNSYDSEWGTTTRKAEIDSALKEVYDRLTVVLKGSAPIYIVDLVNAKLPEAISATLSEKEWRLIRFALEKEWRLIRFALERARDSL